MYHNIYSKGPRLANDAESNRTDLCGGCEMNLSHLRSKLDSFCNEMKTAWTDHTNEVAGLKAATMKLFEKLNETKDCPDQRSAPITLPLPADSLEGYEKWIDSLVRVFWGS